MAHSIGKFNSEILGGTPAFSGTRVPAKALFDYIEAGDSIDKFVDKLSNVRRRQVLELLEAAAEEDSGAMFSF